MAVFVGKRHTKLPKANSFIWFSLNHFDVPHLLDFPLVPKVTVKMSHRQATWDNPFLPPAPEVAMNAGLRWATPLATPVSSEEQISQEQTMVRITPQRDWVLLPVLFCLEAFKLEAGQIRFLGQHGRVKLKELLATRPAVTSSVALGKPPGLLGLGFLASSLRVGTQNLKIVIKKNKMM